MQNNSNNKSKEILESQLRQLELDLKWRGLPLYLFVTTFSALIWAIVSSDLVFNNIFLNLFLLAVFFSRACLLVTSEDIERVDQVEPLFKKMISFKREIKNHSKFNLVMDLICLFIIFSKVDFDPVNYFNCLLKAYFLFHSMILFFQLFLSSTLSYLENKDFMNGTKVVENKSGLYWSFFDLFVLILYSFFIFGFFKIMNISLNEIKIIILLTGLILVCELYALGNYHLKMLTLKRQELENLLNSELG